MRIKYNRFSLHAEGLLPFFLPKADQENPAIHVDCERALNEITVCGEQGENRVRIHPVDFFLEIEGAVILSGGVQDSAYLPLAGIQHGLEFALAWRGFTDGEFFKIDVLGTQPIRRISACGAGLVGVGFEHFLDLFNGISTRTPSQKP